MATKEAVLAERIAELEAELGRRDDALRELDEARSALMLREQQFRMIADNVREVLFLRDPVARRMLYVNPVFEELWQVTAEQLYEDPEAFLRAIVPEDRERVAGLFRVQHEEGGPLKSDYRIQVGAGPLRWMSARSFPVKDEAGRVRYVVGVAEDITDRKQREQSQEARLRLIVETAFEGILTLDAGSVVTFVNARMEQITGYRKEEMVGRPVADFLGPIDAATQPARLARRASGISEEFELAFIRKDGRPVETRLAASPIMEHGNFVGALAMVTDVTERNRNERRVRASLAEKEVLLREVHHRVKNNLQVVSSLLSLQANTVQDEPARIALDESRERIQSIALAHELLYRSDDLARIDFHAYLRELVKVLAAPFVRPEVSVELDLEAPVIELPIDVSVPCGLLVNELLTNALRHAFPSGSPGRVTISCLRRDTLCELSVSDDGVGIAPGVVSGQPRTLGLRLVNSLVRQLGGELEVVVERGSRFSVRFPLAGPMPSSHSQATP
ncbi:MAG: PAS domain S-box protein [Archangium sp.]|nr:PAS domain S-box protein [Archangium sp.]